MKNTAYEPSYSAKNYGEMARWLREAAGDNEGELRRLRRNLRVARECELTPRQQQMLELRYEQGLRVTQIARVLGVNKSTVTRTIARAEHRLERCLRYAL